MYTTHFNDADCRDTREVGGKAAGLAEMTGDGLPVAPGFAVTAQAYRDYIEQAHLRQLVSDECDKLDRGADRAQVARTLQEAFAATGLPDHVADAVRAAYRELCQEVGMDDVSVAVRSSATAEDSVGASFAGEFETWVDVVGQDDVLRHVQMCYDSVYSERVLDYLVHAGIDPRDIEMAVVVQKTVRARAAGVMFTIAPSSGDRTRINIEANWGLGLSVVGGEATPDRYVLSKIDGELLECHIGSKQVQYVRGDQVVPVPEDRQVLRCLADHELAALVKLGKSLERLHDGKPQDIEFAIDSDLPDGENVILLQCRPETVWSSKERKPAFDAGADMMSWITGSIMGAPKGLDAVDRDHHVHDESN